MNVSRWNSESKEKKKKQKSYSNDGCIIKNVYPNSDPQKNALNAKINRIHRRHRHHTKSLAIFANESELTAMIVCRLDFFSSFTHMQPISDIALREIRRWSEAK